MWFLLPVVFASFASVNFHNVFSNCCLRFQSRYRAKVRRISVSVSQTSVDSCSFIWFILSRYRKFTDNAPRKIITGCECKGTLT